MGKIIIPKAYKQYIMIKRIVIFLVPLLLLFSFLPSFVYADLVDVIVDRSTASVGSPQVATDGNGHIYAVWEDTRNGNTDIYFNYSSDYGFNWQPSDIRIDTDAPGANNSTSPQIACDDSGHVYVAWNDSRNGNSDIYFNVSSNYGATWLSTDKKLNTVSPADSPRIACDNTGYVYAAWNNNYFNTSSDYGVNWLSDAINISTSGGTETQLTCDQNGHVYIAWITLTPEVLFNYSVDHGTTWQATDRIVSSAGAIPTGLSSDSDENGHVYIAWHDGRNNPDSPDIYFNSSSDSGNTWGVSDIRLNTGSPGSNYSIWPEVACDEAGHVYVVWYDRRDGLGDIYLNFSSDFGANWQSPDMRLDTDTPGAVDSGYPQIACDNNGHIYTVWADDQAGIGPGLYVNYSLDNGATWLSMNRKIGSSGLNPQITTDDERFYIIRDNSDILFNEIAPLNVPPFPPSDPSPANGATQVSLTPTLSWRGGDANLDDTLTYDVYFGTSSPPLFSTTQAGTSYIPGNLSYSTTYYWQIIVRDSAGAETAGPIWSFLTVDNFNDPPELDDFSPPDLTTDVELGATLSWTGTDPDPGDTITYDVYFGSSIPPALKTTDQTSSTYNPGQLSSGSRYYWRIVARDNYGNETTGPLLSFTTLNNPPQFTSYNPADGETGVSLTPILQWDTVDPDPGDIVRYDVYFGPSSPPPLVVTSQGAQSYSPAGQLTHMTVYYWYIVARDNHGAETESPIQSFTTLDNPPQFVSFSPYDGSIGISLTPTLSWTAIDPDPPDTLVYDIYFGTTSPAPLVLSNQTVTTYQPGQLSYSTRYYWKVIARDDYGVETSMAEIHFDTYGIDTIVDHTSATVNHPQIATDGNGHIYVVWEDTRNGSSDIYLNYSSDYGLTWQTSDIRLDTDAEGVATSNSPQIACDNSGHVYVVWEDERNGTSDVYFNFSSDYGATWLPSDRKLNTSAYAPPAQYPKIACDNSGHVYVAWNNTYFNTSADYGVNWLTQPIRISNSDGNGTLLTCDQDGHVYIAWKTSDVLFNFSSNFGTTWQTTDRIVSSAGAIPYALSLDSDGNGHVYLTWDDGRTNADSPDIYFNSSSDYGNTWGASDIKLNTGTPGSTYSIRPEVASDEIGHVYVTWYDRRNGLGDIYINSSSDYGTNWWASDMRIDTDSPGASDSGYPKISVDVNGYVYVTWNDNQGSVGGPGMYMNYSPDYGATWLSTNRKIGSSGFNPQTAIDDSHLYIVRDNNHAIFTGIALFFPMYPSPADGADEVSITPSLSWSGGNLFFDHMLTYDIYFGTSSPPPLVSSNQTETTYDPGTLSYFTTYYWQVVSKDSSGTEIAGPIWTFTTVSNPPQFVEFSPTDGATGVETAPTLTWTAFDPDPGDTITYDVYFGRNNPPALKETNQTSNTYSPSFLLSVTTYYWQVVARDNHGSETVGPVLSFTTLNTPPVFTSFTPDDNATGVSLTPTIKWLAYDPDLMDSKHYDVYFGDSSPPPLVSSNQTDRAYSPGQLNHMTVYYWKVVVRDNYGAEVESPILSFTTLSNPPVLSNFSPANKSIQVSVTPTLSWSGTDPDPGDTVVYDIYFEEGNNPPSVLVASDQTATSWSPPGEISYATKFFWKIVARDNYGIEKVGPVLSFTTVSRPPEFTSFTPADDATRVDLDPVLMWSAIDPDPNDKIVYDVYFGYAAKSLILKDSNRKSSTYKPGVQPSLTTCYWKVVAKDKHGIKTVSPVLSFTTGSKPPKITNFNPANHAKGVSLTRTLSWWAYDEDPRDTVTCDVYFGTSSDPPLIVSNQVSQSYSPGELEPFTTYYWKIVARDNHGDETVGPILSFTTNMISSINPNPCKAGRIAHINGKGFGGVQGTGEIHLGSKVFGPGSPRIKEWSDTLINFRIPPFNGWPPGTLKSRKVWVTIKGVDSNKVTLKIRKPRD
jgi:hypothetical protein